MIERPKPPEGFDESPEWTDDDFAAAQPAAEVLPPATVAALTKSKGGRPRGSDKEQVTLRIDRDVLDHFRAAGPGWQTRMNDALRAASAK